MGTNEIFGNAYMQFAVGYTGYERGMADRLTEICGWPQ
jgi:hypothetical protein